MFGLSGIKCKVCGIALENPKYIRDEKGSGMYWANPDLTPYTDVKLDFCGPVHSTQWMVEQIEARKNVTQDVSSQTTD